MKAFAIDLGSSSLPLVFGIMVFCAPTAHGQGAGGARGRLCSYKLSPAVIAGTEK